MTRCGVVLVCVLTMHTAPTERMGERFLFIVDCSGSMSTSGKLEKAIRGYSEIAEQASDSMSMRVIAFDTNVYSWRGMQRPETGDVAAASLPPHWVPLPDAEAIPAAVTWLYSHANYSGTMVGPALRRGIGDKYAQTVVLITDGELTTERPSEVLRIVEVAQAARVAAELPRVTLAIVCVGSDETVPPWLVQLATAGHGGLFRVQQGGSK